MCNPPVKRPGYKVKQYSSNSAKNKVKGVICHGSTKPSFPVVPSGGNLQCQIADNRQTPVLSLSHQCGSQSPICFNECETGESGVIIDVATTSMRHCQRRPKVRMPLWDLKNNMITVSEGA